MPFFQQGRKEVIDLIVDLIIKKPKFNDTIFCIDEPELHLNTKIQRALLLEIDHLIPENCQLWIATHSIGFLRALQEDLKEKAYIFDFGETDYFTGSKIISPMRPTRSNCQRIFQTALDDLAYLIAPTRIVYCEGRADPAPNGAELCLDAGVFNHIFSEEFSDTILCQPEVLMCFATRRWRFRSLGRLFKASSYIA